MEPTGLFGYVITDGDEEESVEEGRVTDAWGEDIPVEGDAALPDERMEDKSEEVVGGGVVEDDEEEFLLLVPTAVDADLGDLTVLYLEFIDVPVAGRTLLVLFIIVS